MDAVQKPADEGLPSENLGEGPSTTPSDGPEFVISVKFGPEKYSDKWAFHSGAALEDILLQAQMSWPEYDWKMSKIMIEKRVPGFKSLLKSPDDDKVDISPLDGNSIRLMAPKSDTQKRLQEARTAALSIDAARRAAMGAVPRIRQSRGRTQEDNAYTFHTIRPLSYLPNPERSRQFLEKLKADPGIKASMRKHKFSVGLLTEMDPSQYTESNHEGTTRILGLNRNQGEVIELRLRTDAYDGYRDYKTIRKTLCHELAHNVHGPHDRNFWDLCHQIEREVHEADWKSGGRSVGDEEYRPVIDDTHEDAGGWVGGSYTLGGSSQSTAGLSRREILARAAESRWRNMNDANKDGGDQGRGQGSGGGSSA
ncbi:WLM domain-containing protein [Cercophora newfieldiana]|uniref:WLM domain-containing protein n=1 Tax=Cercophora newfieldiana TaxID=92897 RepID=A0AA39XTH8_9PEZI|nr:WLM domain-containing protein [Cercophora newfieldiana]